MVKSSPQKKTPNRTNTRQQQFKGVRMRKWGKWVSEVRVPYLKGKGKIWLGSYDTPQQAAHAYDCAVYCLRGLKQSSISPTLCRKFHLLLRSLPLRFKLLQLSSARKNSGKRWTVKLHFLVQNYSRVCTVAKV
ncbi:hypothetical protein SUGI_0127660 [Cryptomeria japonica]|nr:hypothetical protein SUGI_0127660 [Cryptomeria japonica]